MLELPTAPHAGLQRPEPVVSPLPSRNEQDAEGRLARQRIAKSVLEQHVYALRSRQQRDLLSEKLLLHIDGSADFQWADILNGTSVEIPRLISEWRKTENVLRLLVDNAVAHHTTMGLKFFAQTTPDRQARQRSLLDTIWINDVALDQDFNGLASEALYMAMPAGFCPMHVYWREDAQQDWHEAISYGDENSTGLFPGMLDCWTGSPFGMVFDVAAKRGSVRWASYERTLPADLVRSVFGHIPEVAGLQGTTRMPSAADFQRIARKWMLGTLGEHGTPIQTERRGEEEVVTLICREIAPGAIADYPEGRLQIIAVPGDIDLRRQRSTSGHAILLADQPLPGNDFSWTLFYSHHRGNDIHGKPWIEDLDQLQVDLNIALSKHWEVVNRQFEAPIVAPGGAMADDLVDLDGYALLEIEASAYGNWRPTVMEWPQSIILGLEKEIEYRRDALYRMGGYQAASRGESPGSRTPYRAILALQQADNTIHGPVNQRFQRSMCDFARRCHSQFRAYGDVPWLIRYTGDEYSYLAESYIDATRISQRPPNYVLVNGFGSSPEVRAQEILELMTLRGADGGVFMTTEEARRQYPNQTIFDSSSDPTAVQRRRANTIASAMHDAAVKYREETGLEEVDPAHPWVQQAGWEIFMWAEKKYQRKRDDLLEAHLAAYTEITQDETAEAIARVAIGFRQELYYQWQAMMAGIPVAGGGPEAPAGGGAPPRPGQDQRAVGAEVQSGGARTTFQAEDADEGRAAIAATAR